MSRQCPRCGSNCGYTDAIGCGNDKFVQPDLKKFDTWFVKLPTATALTTVNVREVTKNTVEVCIGSSYSSVRYATKDIYWIEKVERE